MGFNDLNFKRPSEKSGAFLCFIPCQHCWVCLPLFSTFFLLLCDGYSFLSSWSLRFCSISASACRIFFSFSISSCKLDFYPSSLLKSFFKVFLHFFFTGQFIAHSNFSAIDPEIIHKGSYFHQKPVRDPEDLVKAPPKSDPCILYFCPLPSSIRDRSTVFLCHWSLALWLHSNNILAFLLYLEFLCRNSVHILPCLFQRLFDNPSIST